MNTQSSKIQLLYSAPIPKALLALGLPTMLGMLINALYNLVDTYFVGGLGTEQMGAITVAYPLGQIVVGLGLLFGNGAASCLPRLLGRSDKIMANGEQGSKHFSLQQCYFRCNCNYHLCNFYEADFRKARCN